MWSPALPGIYSASCSVSKSWFFQAAKWEKATIHFQGHIKIWWIPYFITFEDNFPIMLLLYLLMMAESREQKNSAPLFHNLNQVQFSAWEPYFMEAVEIYYFSVKGNDLAKYVSRILPFVKLEFAPVYILLCMDMSKFQDLGSVPVQCLHVPPHFVSINPQVRARKKPCPWRVTDPRGWWTTGNTPVMQSPYSLCC